MFQNETLEATPPATGLQARPLAVSFLAGTALAGLGLFGIDLFDAFAAEARLRDALEQTAQHLAPKIGTSALFELQAFAEEEMRAMDWPREVPEVTVTVIGTNLRVRALTQVDTHLMRLMRGSEVSIDVSATASVPRRRNLLGMTSSWERKIPT